MKFVHIDNPDKLEKEIEKAERINRAEELIKALNKEGGGKIVHGALQVAILCQARMKEPT